MEQAHPCVRRHPESGRAALFVNGIFTKRFEGWTEDESTPLLRALVAHASRAENVYRHEWREGDVVCWDNRCTMHSGPESEKFPETAVREFLRTTVTPRTEERPAAYQAPAAGSDAADATTARL